MEYKESLKGILINMQRKYNKINEIHDLTKELENALHRNDNVSMNMVLAMRQQAMLDVDKIDADTNMRIRNMIPEEALRVRKFINQENIEFNIQEERLISDLNGKIKRALQNIIIIDKVLNKKVGKKDSFYAN